MGFDAAHLSNELPPVSAVFVVLFRSDQRKRKKKLPRMLLVLLSAHRRRAGARWHRWRWDPPSPSSRSPLGQRGRPTSSIRVQFGTAPGRSKPDDLGLVLRDGRGVDEPSVVRSKRFLFLFLRRRLLALVLVSEQEHALSEVDRCCCEIPFDDGSDLCKLLDRKEVGLGEDGEDVASGREAGDGSYLGLREVHREMCSGGSRSG